MGWLRVWVEYVGVGGRMTTNMLILSPLELAPEGTREAFAAILIACSFSESAAAFLRKIIGAKLKTQSNSWSLGDEV